MAFRCGDPEADFDRRERENERWLKSRPICSYCKCHIQEDRYIDIDGEYFHTSCAEILNDAEFY